MILSCKNLSIAFGGHLAVDNISTAFEAGTLTSIVGPNGAGKTTFLNLLSGQLRASTGNIYLDDKDITRLSVAGRVHEQIGRSFQLTHLFANLSVFENIRLAVSAKQKTSFRFFSLASNQHDINQQAMQVLEMISLTQKCDELAAGLSHSDQRKLEVGILMALEPKIYLFDEPTAGMSIEDTPEILAIIQMLKQRADCSIIMVEHKMQVVQALSDRIIVLHNGQLLADGAPDEVIALPIVQQAYLGIPTESAVEAL